MPDTSESTLSARLQGLGPEVLLCAMGLAWAALAALDPFRPGGSVSGPALAVAALVTARLRRTPWTRLLIPLLLTLAFALSARITLEFRADSELYFAYLRSAVFDHDLDFTNEWEHFERRPGPPTETGLRRNAQSVGPALLWSPFYLAAHVYVLADNAWGGTRFPVDGYSAPYRRATAVGTLTVVVLGAALLFASLRPLYGTAIATLAVGGAVTSSPVLYYAFVVPMMSHGVAFGSACAFLYCWNRARQTPSLSSWILLGAVLGLVTICRWQGALYGIMALILAAAQLRGKTVRLTWLLAAAGCALVVFAPQMVAWRVLFGKWLTVPQGPGFLHWTSPNWLNTLISADHGFFNWTPVMFLGFLGLILGVRRFPLLFASALVVFFATVWTNGSVPIYDWQAGDAFGARRFSVIVPLMACGLGAFLETSSRLLKRSPLLAPAALLLAAAAWNLGLIGHFRARRYPEMAPLDRLARDQVVSLREATSDLAGWLAGAEGRALVYKIFSAEYFYTRFNRSGTIRLYSADERYLLDGWGTRSRRVASPLFRRALYPEACVRIPLEGPFALRATITARTPDDPDGKNTQSMVVLMNGTRLTASTLTSEWREVEVSIPAETLVPGENALCLRFANAPPEGSDDEPVAALVSRIQLP